MATLKCTSKSFQMRQQVFAEDMSITKAAMKRFNKEAKAVPEGASPPHILVELEGFTDADGSVVQAKEVKMLPSLDGREKVWVQLDQDTLTFIRGAFASR